MLWAAWPFDTDDAFITLRYAQHLAEGHGIVWNVGEQPPVEGYSNFLFVLLGALAFALGLDPIVVLKLAGVVALAGTCALLWVLARRWVGALAAMVPAVVLTAYEGTINWTVSGLETSVYQAFVVAAVTAFVVSLGYPRRGEPERPASLAYLAGAGVLCFFASITRPEGPLVAVAIGLGLLVHQLAPRKGARFDSKLKPLLWFAATFAVPYALYFAWRLYYFERLLPNSVYCKSLNADDTLALLIEYRALVLPYLVFAVAHPPRSLDARFVTLFAIPVMYVAVLYRVDPIIGHFNRHALTAWALILVAATVGLDHLLQRIERISSTTRELVAISIALAWSTFVAPPVAQVEAHAQHYAARMADRQAVGEWLASRIGDSGDAYVVGDCGLIPLVAKGHAIDAYCLNSRAMTTPPISGSQSRFIEHVYASAPAYLVVHSSHPTKLEPRPEYGVFKALVSHPRFSDYELAARFGNAGSTFHYWIYRRTAARARE